MNPLFPPKFFPLVSLAFLAANVALAPVWASSTVTQATEADLLAAAQGGGVVVLDFNGTISLSNTISVTSDLVLDGTGHDVTLDGKSTVRLFRIAAGVSLTIKNLVLQSGHDGGTTNGVAGTGSAGGAIYNDHGNLVLADSKLNNHRIAGNNGQNAIDATFGKGGAGGAGGSARGGAIYNDGGCIVITNTIFSMNSAKGGAGGNGSRGSVQGNGGDGGNGGAGGAASGGAIYNTKEGSLMIYDSTFSSNTVAGATGGTGGLSGGGLGFNGTSGSSVAGFGGAIFNEGGNVRIVNSTFGGNRSQGASSGDSLASTGSADGVLGRSGGDAVGAAVCNAGGRLAITNVTFYGNLAAGGMGGKGGRGGSTSFGGDGGDGGTGGNGVGGGLYNTANGNVVIVNCTFSNNGAQGGQGGIGGAGGGLTSRKGGNGKPGQSAGGAISNGSGNVILKNSIASESLVVGNAHGKIDDGGSNISSDASFQFDKATSFNNLNPMLGLLQENGGATETLALLAKSPAIDKGDDSACLPTDQRHTPRFGRCDIGAFELNLFGNQPRVGLRALTNGTLALTVTGPAETYELSVSTNLLSWTDAGTFVNTNMTTEIVLPRLTVANSFFYRISSRIRAVITSQPKDQVVTLGGSARFNVQVSGSEPYTFQWFLNRTAITGAVNSALVIADAQFSDAGQYLVTITDRSGTKIDSRSASLIVANLSISPPSISEGLHNQTVLEGTNVEFKVVATGTPPFSYQWIFNGQALAGQTNSTLRLTGVRISDSGNYTVAVANQGGRTNSLATLTVLSAKPAELAPPFLGVTQIQMSVFSGEAPLADSGVYVLVLLPAFRDVSTETETGNFEVASILGGLARARGSYIYQKAGAATGVLKLRTIQGQPDELDVTTIGGNNTIVFTFSVQGSGSFVNTFSTEGGLIPALQTGRFTLLK